MNIYDYIYLIDCAETAHELREIRKKVMRACPENLQSINVAIDQRFAILNSCSAPEQKGRW